MTSKTKTKLLTAASILGVLATTGTAIRFGEKIGDIYENFKINLHYSEEPKWEIKKRFLIKTAKEAFPMIVSSGCTIASIILLEKHSLSVEASLISSLYLAKSQMDSVLKGEEPEEVVLEDITVDDIDVPVDRILIYEPYSDQLIVSSENQMEKAEKIANRKLQQNYTVRLSTIVKCLGGYSSDITGSIGWEMGNENQMKMWSMAECPYIGIKLTRPVNAKGRDVYILKYDVPPSLLNW